MSVSYGMVEWEVTPLPLPSFAHSLFSFPTAPPPFLSSCFVSWGNKEHFVAAQLNSFAIRALTDSGFAFLCSNNFLCFYFLFLPSSLRSGSNAKSNFSRVKKKFFHLGLAERGEGRFRERLCHAQFQSAPQVPIHWETIPIHAQGKLNELTQHWCTAILCIIWNLWKERNVLASSKALGKWTIENDRRLLQSHACLPFKTTGQAWRAELTHRSTCRSSRRASLVPNNSLHPFRQSQLPPTLVSGDPLTSSGLCGYPHAWDTCTHTHICINI